MTDIFEEILTGEPKYRIKQVKEAFFQDLVDDWDEARFLPVGLRERLEKLLPVRFVNSLGEKDFSRLPHLAGEKYNTYEVHPAYKHQAIKVDLYKSADGQTEKALFYFADAQVEAVLMRNKKGRNTVCVSSQFGCPLACVFCATGKLGFKRNLTTWEIILQVLYFARLLKLEGKKITNVVFMGMGEPFLNYENVMGAVRILNDRDGFALGARRLAISTSGVVKGIKRLSGERLEVNLAISLHAADDILRSRLMPVNKSYPLTMVLTAVDEYIAKTGRKVMFEYLMIKGINDRPEDCELLAKLMAKRLYFVNLIAYNPTGSFEASSQKTIEVFKNRLISLGVQANQRYSFGQDIKAACGQLAGKV